MFRNICAVLLCVFTLGYMLPASVAAMRNTKEEPTIFLVNLFFGWTLIGWIVALIMALTAQKRRKIYTAACVQWNDPKDNYTPKLEFVEDPIGIERHGFVELQVKASGITTKEQAQIYGRWILETQRP